MPCLARSSMQLPVQPDTTLSTLASLTPALPGPLCCHRQVTPQRCLCARASVRQGLTCAGGCRASWTRPCPPPAGRRGSLWCRSHPAAHASISPQPGRLHKAPGRACRTLPHIELGRQACGCGKRYSWGGWGGSAAQMPSGNRQHNCARGPMLGRLSSRTCCGTSIQPISEDAGPSRW